MKHLSSEYLEYIHSDTWKARRKKFMETRRRTKCYCCGSRKNLHVHHKTYDNFTSEKDGDLELVCADCHDKLHILVSSRVSKLAVAHEVLKITLSGGFTEKYTKPHHKPRKSKRKQLARQFVSEKQLLIKHGVFGLQDMIKRRVITRVGNGKKFRYLKIQN